MRHSEGDNLNSLGRRSAVMGLHGAVATSQPLATQAGVAMLISGGNAVDAAVAAAAVLTVVEPMMTGLGGDCFTLFFNAESGEIHALNASGRAPQSVTVEAYMRLGLNSIPETGILSVTVPGLVDGWTQLIARHGTKDLAEVLSPAIEYAENGFPVSEIVSRDWYDFENKLTAHPSTAKAYLSNGHPPRPGEVVRQPDLARSLKVISLGGADEFYHGELAERIASFCKAEGGFLTKGDLAMHKSDWVKPITTSYRGFKLYELPPNTIGICAIIALNIIEGYNFGSIEYHSDLHLHLLIEAIKLSFADMTAYVADPDHASIPTIGLLSKKYAEKRRQNIKDNAIANIPVGDPFQKSDTVYLTVVDGEGNAVSLINSLYSEFGSGLVVNGTGICLQNRGSLFSLNPKHPNCIAPGKRPLHTLAPALVLTDGKLFMSFGVRGGWMQPQGHVQVLNNIIDFGMNPQTALNAPRFRYLTGRQVAIEKPLLERSQDSLIRRGHDIVPELPKGMGYGGGQIILKDPQTGSLVAGSDPRTDGCAAAI